MGWTSKHFDRRLRGNTEKYICRKCGHIIATYVFDLNNGHELLTYSPCEHFTVMNMPIKILHAFLDEAGGRSVNVIMLELKDGQAKVLIPRKWRALNMFLVRTYGTEQINRIYEAWQVG